MKSSILGLVVFLALSILGLGCAESEDKKMDSEWEGLPNNPTVQKAWSAIGDMQTENPNKQVSLQAHFDEPGIYTVQFSFRFLDESQAGITNEGPPRVYADIEWSVAGNTIYRRISVHDGASISGNAEGVKVRVYDESVVALDAWIVDYQVGITVAPGVRAGDQPPTLEIYNATYGSWGTIAADDGAGGAIGNWIDVPVPQNAGVKSVMVWGSPEFHDQIVGLDDLVSGFKMTSGIKGYWRPYRTGQVWMPVPPGTRYIRIGNQVTWNQTYSCIFGIDG